MNEFTLQLLRDLYEREYRVSSVDGKDLELSEAGSLSLLAIGYKGTVILRKIRGWRLTDKGLIVNLAPFKEKPGSTEERNF